MAAGEQFFLNDFEITRLSTQTLEYQYHLKDHLGNVRLTFTSKDETETTTATYETANINTEQSQYLRYDNAKRINATLFDRTNGSSTGFSQRLNGSANEKYGLARSLSVMPGDVINAEVYAKYADTNTANWTGTMSTIMSQIAANTAGVVVDGTLYSSSTSSFPAGFVGLQTPTDNGAPKAYLNWLIFDRNYAFITGGFKQITTAAREMGTDVAHERLFNTSPITITQPGYVYIYLSNESTTQVEVFFDDFKVTHTKSPVIQQDDYYPFGLTFNSYQRENSTINNYLYNGKEKQDELDLGWLDYGARMYMSDIGRWGAVDALPEKFHGYSPYGYVVNNPINIIDPDGRDARVRIEEDKENGGFKITISSTIYVTGNNASQKLVDRLNKSSTQNFKSGSSKGENGTTSVNFEVNYVYAENESDVKLGEGDNIIALERGEPGEKSGGEVQSLLDDKEGEVVSYTGRRGVLTGARDQKTVTHETLHLLGLSDRYTLTEGNDKGFKSDVMAEGRGMDFNQVHYDNYGQYFQGIGTGVHILNRHVDVDKNGNLIGGQNKRSIIK